MMDSRSPGEQPAPGVGGILKPLLVPALCLVLAWFLFGGRIAYAASECSKGVTQCLVGIGVAVGIVDVYDKQGRCLGVGCNM